MSDIVSRDPRTGRELGRVAAASPDDVVAAATLARKAFGEWAELGPTGRRPYFKALKAALVRNADHVAEVIAAETGKDHNDALLTEVSVAGGITDYLVRRAPKLLRAERRSPLPFPNYKAWVEYHPRGVAGIISPWNYPFSLPFGPMVNALAAGCTVLVKPSEVTPLSGELCATLAREVDLPTGVVQVVHGGPETGEALVDAADVVSFTGSPRVARMVAARAAQTLTPVILELGGNDAMVVLEDADLRRAARGAVWGGMVNAGQTCISVERIYVVDPVHDEFVAELRAVLDAMRAGGGGRDDIGPIIHPPQFDIVERHVADAVAKGAKVLTGGRRRGAFFEPTILLDVDHTMVIMQEETFGPVIPIMRVPTGDAALELANDSVFGLHGSVWTKDRERGERIASRLRTGTVAVNDCLVNYGMADLPFGGIGESGYGSNNGPEGLRSFCFPKSIARNRAALRRELWWFPRVGGRRLWRNFARFAARR